MTPLDIEMKLQAFIGKSRSELYPDILLQVIELIQNLEFFHWTILQKISTHSSPITGFPIDCVCQNQLQALDSTASSRLRVGLYPFMYFPQPFTWEYILTEVTRLAMSDSPVTLITGHFESPLESFCRSYLRLISCVAKICPEIAAIFFGIPFKVANKLAEPTFDKLAIEILIARFPIIFTLRGKQSKSSLITHQINIAYQDFLYRLKDSDFPSFCSDNLIQQERLKCVRATLQINKIVHSNTLVTPYQPEAASELITLGKTYHLRQPALKRLGLWCGLNNIAACNLARQSTYKLDCGVKKQDRQLTSSQINDISTLVLALLTETTNRCIDSRTLCRALPFSTVLATTLLQPKHFHLDIREWGDLMTQVEQRLHNNLFNPNNCGEKVSSQRNE